MSIQTRLILALSTLAIAVVLAIVLVFQWRFDRGLIDYVNAQRHARMESAAGNFAEQWRRDGNWDALRGNLPLFQRLLRGSNETEPPPPPEEGDGRPQEPPSVDTPRELSGRPFQRFMRAAGRQPETAPLPLRPMALLDVDFHAILTRGFHPILTRVSGA